MIGRKTEMKELEKIYQSGKSEFVAIYGRRRIGKTYLVDETFRDRITFRHAGLSPSKENSKDLLKTQLEHFSKSLKLHGMTDFEIPKNWFDAFLLLELFLNKIDNGQRQIVFLDELPWLDTPKSGFIKAFEGFWNTWGCHKKNLMLIVCGSANSWILDKLINNHGGLYNRVTYEIKLLPFTLKECEDFYKAKNINFSKYDITQSYMVLGGIPYYLGYIDGEYSIAQNIDKLFFSRNAKLYNEYDRLFASIFANPEIMKKIVCFLSTRKTGYTRKEIAEKLGISDGGRLSSRLNALITSDFIIKYVPFGVSKRQEHYKLIDPFCIFYLHFINKKPIIENFWQQNNMSQKIVVWRGYAFENVCFNHINQIKNKLGIAGVSSINSAWSKRSDDEKGLQIDLIISRNDNIVNMCEIKYYGNDFQVDKNYYKILLARQEILSNIISRKSSIQSTLITTFGLKQNEYSNVFSNVIVLEDLFH